MPPPPPPPSQWRHPWLCNEPYQSVCVPLHTGMMLKENNTLKELDLRECGLQPEGLEEVIKGVQVNTKLETLNLGQNIIDAKRASCLGKNTGIMTFHAHIHQLVMPGWDTIITCTTGPSHIPPPHTLPHPSQCTQYILIRSLYLHVHVWTCLNLVFILWWCGQLLWKLLKLLKLLKSCIR